MGAASPLADFVARELLAPAPPQAEALAEEIRARHGPGVAAVLFYGSCLRDEGRSGVLDFYALVDDYAGAHATRRGALANAALPPSVFSIAGGSGRAPRAKYALLSRRDFRRGCAPGALRPYVWARFCQPARAVWLRDAAVRDAVADDCARAVRTAVERGLALCGGAPSGPDALWRAVFRETYAWELRTEGPQAVDALVAADPKRYARALELALAERAPRDAPRAPWPGQRRLAKGLAAAQLLKSMATFGAWLPYALWKLERQTGVRLEPSARQRRHPLLFAWPLFWRALRRRALR